MSLMFWFQRAVYNNTIFGNNFLGQNNFIVTSEMNFWDNGSMGNYWSDYLGTGSYFISSNNVDHYPLTNPVDIYATPNQIPTLTPSLPPSDRNSTPHLDPIYYLIPICVIGAVILASMLLFRRHPKTTS